MPGGGQTTDESLVTYWYKKVGDEVRLGEPLFSVETDKATMDVESCAEGTLLAVYHNADESVKTGELMAFVGKSGEALPGEEIPNPEYAVAQAPKPAGPAAPQNGASAGGAPVASPAARRLARDSGVNLKDIAVGDMPVKKKDVEAALEQRGGSGTDDFTYIEPSPSRRAVAERMEKSVSEAPQFHITVEVGMEKAVALRDALNRHAIDTGVAVKVSYNDILMRCACHAMEKHPMVNSSMDGGRIKAWKTVHFGLAVALENGLAVPVVRHAESKGIGELARANAENIKKAREGILRQEDITGGTITLTNLGMYGVSAFSAILNPPEACILAAGAIEEKPVVRQGALAVGRVMTVTATFDHRIIDGAYGAAFLKELKYLLENVELLLL